MDESANTGRRCVYCGGTGDLTNEHVVPDCYQRAFGQAISIAKTPSGDKAIPNAQEICDVCAKCNNGPLSRLDSYLSVLNAKYFCKIVHPGDRVHFQYDFDLLLRLLLKAAYNVARTRKWPLSAFQETLEFILGQQARPTGFRIFLQLLVPTPMRRTILPITPGAKEVPPFPWRIDLQSCNGFPGIAFACSISFMSYRFFILREDTRILSAIRKRSIKRWLKENKGTSEITLRNNATVYSSSVTVIDTVRGSRIFETQLAKARKLKADMKPKNSKPSQ